MTCYEPEDSGGTGFKLTSTSTAFLGSSINEPLTSNHELLLRSNPNAPSGVIDKKKLLRQMHLGPSLVRGQLILAKMISKIFATYHVQTEMVSTNLQAYYG